MADKCPLCNGKPFKKGDDFKTLCGKHSTEVLAVIFIGFVDDIVLKPARDRREERRKVHE